MAAAFLFAASTTTPTIIVATKPPPIAHALIPPGDCENSFKACRRMAARSGSCVAVDVAEAEAEVE
jgi:hypothetical protein